jgi:DNA-binding CsgD family transcriptional regulator
MDRGESVLGVIEGLYAAALTPADWPATMERIVDAVGGGHTILHAYSGDNTQAVMSGRLEQRDLERFACAEAAFWSQPIAQAMPVGIVVRREEIQTDREFTRSALWNEIVRPADGFHSISLLHKGSAGRFLVSVCRSERAGSFDADAVAALQTLGPHLATALDFHFRLHAGGQQAAAFTRMLDRLDAGAILADASAQPLHMNEQAARITLQRDGLTVEVSGLAAATAAQTQSLRAAIAAAAAATAREGRWLRLERPSCRPPLILNLLPVWRLGAAVPGAPAPRVAVFIREPDAPIVIDRLAVADVFRLTPREGEVAALLAGGRDLAEIAAALGLGIGTVRFHLKRVFDKTGARNQAGLVVLIRNVMDVRVL